MAEQKETQRQFMVQRIYIKDVSFEAPNSPVIFQENWTPEISVGMNNEIRRVGENHYELALKVNVEAKHEGKTVFLVEVAQAGLFLLQGFNDEEADAIMHIGAANVVFPYVRETISDLVSRGSFPQFILQPVNFEALYQQHRQEAAKAAEAAGDPATAH